MSIRVLPHASDHRRSSHQAMGAGPVDPSGRRTVTPEPVQGRRRIRDDARDGLAAAALSLGGSLALTFALGLALRWLG